MPTGSICYHTGLLMRDRLFNRDANTAAHRMLRLSEGGAVVLLQKRLKEGVYQYWAIPAPLHRVHA